MQHDPLNDAIICIKNSVLSGKKTFSINIYSKILESILIIMKESGYIQDYSFKNEKKTNGFNIILNNSLNNCGIIKPRHSVKKINFLKYESRFLPSQNFGVLILSTTKGVITNQKAKELGIGGKLLAYVY